MKLRLTVAIIAVVTVLASMTIQACANSILRNAAEAGLETVLEDPLPTVTMAPSQPTPRPTSGF